ncbi:MAG TPA: 2-dehydropantoate 2-reductase [Thermomicrobiales bacterium]|jgi:2-dehydropantoate 2-reductase
MTSTTPPTALAFVGAGALGQTFAALIAQSGRAVTLLATPRTAAQLREAGQIRLHGAVTADVPITTAGATPGQVQIITDGADLPPSSGLIFLTKGHHLPETIATIRAARSGHDDDVAWVAGFQNGVAKDDLLAAAFGAERVIGGATILSGERRADGSVLVTGLGATYLGELPGGDSPRVTHLIGALTRAGIPAEAPADIRGVLWSKACNAAGVFGVSVLARTTAPLVFAEPNLLRAYLALVRETAAIGAAQGSAVGDYPNFPPIRTFVTRPEAETLAAVPRGPLPRGGSMPSMMQDLLAGRPIEVEGVFGDLVERAAQAGVPAPHLTLVRDLLRGLERIAREG